MRNLHTATREYPPLTSAREKPMQQWRPSTVKNKQNYFLKKEAIKENESEN